MPDSRILAVCPNPSIDILAQVDQLEPGKVSRIMEQKDFPGGKGVHVALAIAEITSTAGLFAFWGGPSGVWIKEECNKRNVNCCGPSVSGWTRSCYTLNCEGGQHKDTELLGIGPLINQAELSEFYHEFEQVREDYDVICMSGSWPKGVGPEAYRPLIELCNNKKVFVDCSGELLLSALEANPFCIHINLQEGKDLYHIDSPVEIVQKLTEHCTIAALTLGKAGLLLASGNQLLSANVKIDRVISAVGSGDCLVGGMAIATANNYNFEDTAKLAVACGAANCLNPDLGMLKRKDVERLFEKATVKKINS